MMIIWLLAFCASASAVTFRAQVRLMNLPDDEVKKNDYFDFNLFDVTIRKSLEKDVGITVDYKITDRSGTNLATADRVLLCPEYDADEQDVKAVELFKGTIDILNKKCPIRKRRVRLQPTFDTELRVDNLAESPCNQLLKAEVQVFVPGSVKKIVKMKYDIIPKC
ncbi:uncharacterized protein [Fopius arisanus]|uniref:BacC_0 protein n=1 Tax=Fopius arisanus TaxID=64838 RepID=A0A0C9RL96_9HYME|nr:PREDICTED: uncharacterized protein LOC105263907 [Fopius arisanus]